ncbi:MAG TPA: tetratricopeptide repeat protein [Candidatus Polarisedimenticolia bacterium]|nr:tetratricopeptide repeat protein [Candidatus Polarisedimenticolia bacterium]
MRKIGSRDWRPLVVFVVAYAVRLVYILEIRKAPYFDVPLIDGPNYFRMAAAIASGSLTGGREVFWQPPLYPYFLALLSVTVGDRMQTIYAVQAALGSLSCVLVYWIGRRLFGARPALFGALVAALYGPLIHFDAQPLIPVLHIVLTLGGLLALLRGAGIGEAAMGGSAPPAVLRRRFFGAGVLWGLAATATPNILFAAPAAAWWTWRRMRPAAAARIFLLGMAIPVLAVTARNAVVANDAVLISSNGGINFFIGNNPDYDRTIRLRPGGEFERLAQEPENLGIVKASARSRYFAARAWQFLSLYPREAARLYLTKTRDLVAGREIPRNQDPYVYRRYSTLFAILLWRLGVSFPFGVVAPLALASCFMRIGESRGGETEATRRNARWDGGILLLLFAGSYALSILAFFPTDRYRLPLVPIAALLAGRLLADIGTALKSPRVLAALAFGLVLFNLDAFRPSEAYPEEEALNRAYALRMKGRTEEARDAYLEAMALNPRRIDPYNSLATMAAEQGRWEETAQRYLALLEIAPDFADVRRSLGEAYLALGRKEEARREWEIAVQLAPGLGLALADLCMSYYDDGRLAVAEPYCERAVRARPDLPETHFAAGLLARAQQRRDRARAELTEAVRLYPNDGPGRRRAEEILEKMRRRDQRLQGEPTPGDR